MIQANGGPISRIKDIADLQSARDNQLVGYGLVIGLQGSGDSLRNSPYTEQSIRAMLENLGIALEGGRARAKNVAAVIVTANLPAFVESGARIDVSVSSLGDATSLNGGTLVMTPLKAADGQIYAVAQGSVSVSGFSAKGDAEQLTQGVPTSGRVPNGGLVERQVTGEFADLGAMTLQLRNADFSTAVMIADVINEYARDRFGKRVASEQDFAHDHPAQAGKHLACALHRRARKPHRRIRARRRGSLSTNAPARSSSARTYAFPRWRSATARLPSVSPKCQGSSSPSPFRGARRLSSLTRRSMPSRPDARIAVLDGPDLKTLVSGLNRMGVKPDGIIAILQGIKSAGALQADLVVQ